jgi:hypothetical protein
MAWSAAARAPRDLMWLVTAFVVTAAVVLFAPVWSLDVRTYVVAALVVVVMPVLFALADRRAAVRVLANVHADSAHGTAERPRPGEAPPALDLWLTRPDRLSVAAVLCTLGEVHPQRLPALAGLPTEETRRVLETFFQTGGTQLGWSFFTPVAARYVRASPGLRTAFVAHLAALRTVADTSSTGTTMSARTS